MWLSGQNTLINTNTLTCLCNYGILNTHTHARSRSVKTVHCQEMWMGQIIYWCAMNLSVIMQTWCVHIPPEVLSKTNAVSMQIQTWTSGHTLDWQHTNYNGGEVFLQLDIPVFFLMSLLNNTILWIDHELLTDLSPTSFLVFNIFLSMRHAPV